MGKLSPTLLLSIVLLLFVELGILCLAKNSSFGCVAHEREALLKFKASLVDHSNGLSSWEEDTNCCNWEGVRCHITGYVVKLDLRNKHYWSKSLDSSLLELKYLNYLDLSGNNFNHSIIPTFLGSMKQLQHVNLSDAELSGIIPHHLGNLSNLRTLDLSYGYGFIATDLTWVSNLSSLEYLDLSQVFFRGTKDLIKVLSMLPSLVVLRLSSNYLGSDLLPHACVNSTLPLSVQYLDLSGNSLTEEPPCFLQNLTSLKFLDLSSNSLTSSGQPFLRLRNLVHVDLGWNQIYHSADWITQLVLNKCHLKSLNLNFNQFHGDIDFKNLSACRIYSLERLDLSSNNFNGRLSGELGKFNKLIYLDLTNSKINGSIPESIGELSALVELEISENKLSGLIPESVGNMRALRKLNLASNQLSGEIPVSLGQLSNVEGIYISDNSFSGTLSEAHFSKLSKLRDLHTASNSIMFKVGYSWMPPFQLNSLRLQSSKFVDDRFPPWLQTQRTITELDLSNCSISGTLPRWLGSMNLKEVSLAKNHITGTIPAFSSSITMLDLSTNMINHLPSNIGHMFPLIEILLLANNVINGTLPNSLCEMKALQVLHLSRNYFSGNLPGCWQNFHNLTYVGLSFNELSGIIPNGIGGAYSLNWLRLNNNNLRGQLPFTLMNCTHLKGLDVGENKLSGRIPEWIGNALLDLKVLRLRNNQFHGLIPPALCQASRLQILDLAINKLTGYIPGCFHNFSGMISPEDVLDYWVLTLLQDSLDQVFKGMEMNYTSTPLANLANLDLSSNKLAGEIPSELTTLVGLRGLNLSCNHLEGEIPKMIGGLNLLESLDLSNNNLFGRIPESLSNLSFLSRLNLSNNNLSGQIPLGRQLQTLDDPSVYGGNPQLCGAPLPKKCQSSEPPKHTNAENLATVEEDTVDTFSFYAFIIGGFATGFWGFFGILVFKQSWKLAYFHYIEVLISKMLGH